MHNNSNENDNIHDLNEINSHCFPRFESDYINSQNINTNSEFNRFWIPSDNITIPTDMEKKNESSIKSITDEAYNKGFSEGSNEGFLSGQKIIDPLVNKLELILKELDEAKRKLYHIAEKEAVELSIAIAKKIVGNELEINKNLILNTIREALKKVEGHGNIRVKLNPKELELVSISQDTIKSRNSAIEKINFEPDDNVTQGGCIVHTNIGEIDARIEKQLEVIEEMFQVEK